MHQQPKQGFISCVAEHVQRVNPILNKHQRRQEKHPELSVFGWISVSASGVIPEKDNKPVHQHSNSIFYIWAVFLYCTERKLTVRRGTSGVWWCRTSCSVPRWSGPFYYLKPLYQVWLSAPAHESLHDHWRHLVWQSATTNTQTSLSKLHKGFCSLSAHAWGFMRV